MLRKSNKIRVSVSRSLYVYISILLLLIPLRLLFAFLFSAFFHEICHVVALRIMKVDIHSVCVGVRGTKIETASMNTKEELICALAGPMGGFLLFLQFRYIPVIALTGAVQSLYNLLPIYPTDGGRVLKCLINMVFPDRIVCGFLYTTEVITLSAITAFCVIGSFWLRLGMIPVLFSGVLILQCTKRNYPCKPISK